MNHPYSLKNLDPAFLMWDMRRNLKPLALPDRRCTVEFIYPEVDRGRRYWWLVIEDGAVTFAESIPGMTSICTSAAHCAA